MTWLEISFESTQTLADRCSQLLEELGARSVSFYNGGDTPILEPLPGETPLWEKVKVVGLFEEPICIEKIRKALQNFLPNTPLQIAPLAERDWVRAWLDHFHPMRFGQRLWIIPSNEGAPINQNAIIVKLDPGLAFGTGTHPTTALCLRWLDANPPIDHEVIDFGCGSGILGIAALKLGAKKVLAIDHDPQALGSTKNNAQRNDIPEGKLSTFLPGDFEPKVSAQTVLANILALPLIKLAPTLSAYCAPGGKIVLSGLLTDQIEMVQNAYQQWFSFGSTKTQGEWALLVGTKLKLRL